MSQEVGQWCRPRFVDTQPPANSVQRTENSTGLPGTLPDLFAFERLGSTFSSPPTQPGSASFNVDGGFTPEIPSSYIRAIQSGEFFDIEKLLPENMHKISCEVGDGALSITVGSNSELKLVSRAAKKKIKTISDWTSAFTLYMKVIVDKYPARVQELIGYLDLIRYAAKYHNSFGWYIYDNKFRNKAANDRSLSWALIDQQLWTRLITVSQSQLEADYALFFQWTLFICRIRISCRTEGRNVQQL